MTAALAWLFVAAALLLVPAPALVPAGGRSEPAHRRRAVEQPAGLSPRAMQLIAAAAVSAVSLVTFGPVRGALLAAVLVPAAAVALDRLQRRPARASPDASLALGLDLLAATLRGGQPLTAALRLVAPVTDRRVGAELARVAGLLRLGADPDEAWRVVADDPVLAPVAVAARRSATSGVRLARAFEQLAEDVRAQLRAAAQARAHRAGVIAMAPLGLCFLPAFVCLGIAPVVAGIVSSVFGAVP